MSETNREGLQGPALNGFALYREKRTAFSGVVMR